LRVAVGPALQRDMTVEVEAVEFGAAGVQITEVGVTVVVSQPHVDDVIIGFGAVEHEDGEGREFHPVVAYPSEGLSVHRQKPVPRGPSVGRLIYFGAAAQCPDLKGNGGTAEDDGLGDGGVRALLLREGVIILRRKSQKGREHDEPGSALAGVGVAFEDRVIRGVVKRGPAIVRVGVLRRRVAGLAEIGLADDLTSLFPGLLERGQQHPGQDGDDRNYNEELY